MFVCVEREIANNIMEDETMYEEYVYVCINRSVSSFQIVHLYFKFDRRQQILPLLVVVVLFINSSAYFLQMFV